MRPFFPKQVSVKAILVYFLSLTIVSVVFFDYAMSIGYMVLGCIWVIGFFLLAFFCSTNWKTRSTDQYIGLVFSLALTLRLIWVVYSYFYYIDFTGQPFEYDTADALAYHLDAEWLAGENWYVTRNYLFGKVIMLSDSGYPLYLSIVYRIFGSIIIIPRIIKALLSTITCILIYKLSSRTFGEGVGRLAGIMMALMPNLIIYCGYHLKETEMLFLEGTLSRRWRA